MSFRPQTLAQVDLQLKVVSIALFALQFMSIFCGFAINRFHMPVHRVIRPVADLPLFTVVATLLAFMSIALGVFTYLVVPKAFFKGLRKKAATAAPDRNFDADGLVAVKVTQANALMALPYCGSGSVFGWGLFSIGGDSLIILPFAMASIVALIICRPTKAYYERVAQRVQEWQRQTNG